MTADYGTTTYEGVSLTLTQEAYFDRNYEIGENVYRAGAVDAAGNKWEVEWDLVVPDCDDESLACDWDHPIRARIIERGDE